MSYIQSYLDNLLIPCARDGLNKRLVLVRSRMNAAQLPAGVTITPKKIIGKRVPVYTRDDGPRQIVRARWPDSGLHEQFCSKLICVLEGNTDFWAGNYVISCSRGHFILLPPLMPNTTGERSHLEGIRRQNGSCQLLQIYNVHGQLRCSMCRSDGEEHENVETRIVDHPHATYLFDLFTEETLHPQPGNNQLHGHLLASVFIFIQREIAAGRTLRGYTKLPEGSFNNSPIQEIHNYIRTHLHQSLTIKKVAHAVYMSPSNFTRLLRRETGKSFVEVLTEYRIEAAKRSLDETSWSVKAIARHVGLRSSTYFIAFFEKHVGCSPTEYRRKSQKESK